MMRCVWVVNAMKMVHCIATLNTSIASRLSPCPKVISGEGLIDPRRLRQIMRQQSTSALRECSIHMSNRNESCDSFPQSIIVMVPQYLSYWLVT
jgi:hypothetical protein